MKIEETPWSMGALFICSKCGKSFDRPQQAEELKNDLRKFLKEKEKHKDIRVMVSGCLNICDPEFQTISFHPVDGKTEVITVENDYTHAKEEIKKYLERKLK